MALTNPCGAGFSMLRGTHKILMLLHDGYVPLFIRAQAAVIASEQYSWLSRPYGSLVLVCMNEEVIR